MDWIERLNLAIRYIDENLDSDIDYDEISRITLSPIALFQRFFVLATGITLNEYIRRRKITNALIELQNTDNKVIDIAVKYGYDSPDAFRVAFKRLYGINPSQVKSTKAKNTQVNLKHYNRIFLTLKINYIRGENEMILKNIDKYRYYGPLFEGLRIILNYMGEKYTPEYIQGISGAAFKIACGCPSRPTCVCDYWTVDLIKLFGYEVKEYPCFDDNENDISDIMIAKVKKQIDNDKPVLVWNAFTNSEFDVVCGYDDEEKQFIGKGTYRGNDELARESYDRPKLCDSSPAMGAIVIGNKISRLNQREAEINSLRNAVIHARKKTQDKSEGIEFYKEWVKLYSNKGADRGVADSYCLDVYSSVRKACIIYLREISIHFGGSALEYLQKAANYFECEAELLANAKPYISWESPWGVDENRSKIVAPILSKAANNYENGIEYIEKALKELIIVE